MKNTTLCNASNVKNLCDAYAVGLRLTMLQIKLFIITSSGKHIRTYC